MAILRGELAGCLLEEGEAGEGLLADGLGGTGEGDQESRHHCRE